MGATPLPPDGDKSARYSFRIDAVAPMSEKALAYLKKIKALFKQKRSVSPQTGRLDMRFDPMAIDNDYFVRIVK